MVFFRTRPGLSVKIGFREFKFILARNYNGLGEYMDRTWRVHDVFWFILTRNYNGFVQDMDSLDQADL